MYEEFFKFSSPPFRLNPDPKFFFGSRSHNKAMAYLHYGLRQGEGFIVITGEIGAGKSMLISHLMDQLDRSNVVAAHLLTASLEPSALLPHVLSAFRIEPAGKSESAAIEAFEDFLFDQMNRGRRVLLVVDEAQNLPVKTIEELRMLSNMDYDGTPLFQVFLVGQPEFRSLLKKPEMEQFRQRVIASYHLEPLSQAETTDYIKHRLSLVGWTNDPAIAEDACAAIFAATGGVPRKINKLCNRIFLFCGIEKRHRVDVDVVNTVVADLRAETVGGAETPPERAAESEMSDSAEEKPGDANAKQAVKSREDAVSTRKTRAAAASGGAAGPRSSENRKGGRAPVVIPFEQARRIASKEAKPAAPAESPCADNNVETTDVKGEGAAGGDERATNAAPEKAKADGVKDLGNGERAMNETAPPEAVDRPQADHMSVFDRLRAQRRAEKSAAAPAPETAGEAEAAATLSDVAKAIEEAAAGASASPGEDADGEHDALIAQLDSPGLDADPEGGRRSIIKSINETRDDLKAAHRDVSHLRRRLSDIDKRRLERRRRLAASLTRAQSLLAEIENS